MSRNDLERKVGPLVELTATRNGEPGRYDRLGGARFGALKALSKWAALYIAASRKCDTLVDVDTRASTREELVWRGRCKNGQLFTVFENDVSAAREKLQGSLNETTMAAISPPDPDDGFEPDELAWLRSCNAAFKAALPAGEVFLHKEWKLSRRKAGQRMLTVRGTASVDAFHEGAARYECRVDVKSAKIVTLNYVVRGVSGSVGED